MPRWPEDSRDRLIEAALELFTRHGYSAVTIDDIARRADLSPRTFFRYFPDKEEVLFADDDDLLPTLLAAITDSPPARMTAEQDMNRAFAAMAAVLDPRRESLQHRQRIIDSQMSLSGRELAKQARWQRKVMEALSVRGYDPDDADILAAIGFAVFRRALHAWLADAAGPDLGARLRTALPRARTVLDAGPRPQPAAGARSRSSR